MRRSANILKSFGAERRPNDRQVSIYIFGDSISLQSGGDQMGVQVII